MGNKWGEMALNDMAIMLDRMVSTPRYLESHKRWEIMEPKLFNLFGFPLFFQKNAHKHIFSYNFRRLINSPDTSPWVHIDPQVKMPWFIPISFFFFTDRGPRLRVVKPLLLRTHTAVHGRTELELGLQTSRRERSLPKAPNYGSVTGQAARLRLPVTSVP